MKEGRYTRVKSRFWGDEKVRLWDNDMKFLALYLLTSPHGNILGCFVLHKLYICADLNWTPQQLEAPFNRLIAEGFIRYDETTNLILITKFLHHNPVTNPNQVKACIKQLNELPKSLLLKDLKDLVEGLGKGLGKDLYKDLVEALGYTVTVSVTVPVTVSVSENIPAEEPKPPAPKGARNKNKPYTDEFEIFWSKYPRKVDKRSAFRNWERLLAENSPVTVETLISCAENYSLDCELAQRETQFIKHPTTFLSPLNRPFESYLVPPTPEKKMPRAFRSLQDFARSDDNDQE